MTIYSHVNGSGGGDPSAEEFDADTGTATPTAMGVITIAGGEGVDTSASSNTVTISGEDATTANKGIASFTAADFGVVAGNVSLADEVVKSVDGDSGTATPSGHSFTIAGGSGLTSSAAGSTVTVNLDSPVDETLGGTGQTTYATGDILYASAANTLSKLAAGSDDEVLTLASGVPSWAAAAGGGGGWVFLDSATASSSASLDFSSSIDGTYNMYAFVLDSIAPASDSVLLLRTSSDGGSSYDSGVSDYGWAGISESLDISDSSDAQIRLAPQAVGGAANESLSGTVFVINPFAASFTRIQSNFCYTNSTGSVDVASSAGVRLSAASVDAVRFLFSSANIASGTISLYGVSTPS